MIKLKHLFERAGRLIMTCAAMALSTHICAATSMPSPVAAASTGYLPTSHTREQFETAMRPLAVAGAIPEPGSVAAHPARVNFGELMEWYDDLGRHGQALTLELLLIGC